MAGFYGAPGIQHAKWKLSPRAAGTEMVFSQIRLVADAVFYFLRWRLRHSRQLRDRSPRPSGIARLHPAASTKRCHLIRVGQRAHARDDHPRYRGSADALRRKMAVAILNDCLVNVRFGSKADICGANGMSALRPESGHVQRTRRCLLWAKSGLTHRDHTGKRRRLGWHRSCSANFQSCF